MLDFFVLLINTLQFSTFSLIKKKLSIMFWTVVGQKNALVDLPLRNSSKRCSGYCYLKWCPTLVPRKIKYLKIMTQNKVEPFRRKFTLTRNTRIHTTFNHTLTYTQQYIVFLKAWKKKLNFTYNTTHNITLNYTKLLIIFLKHKIESFQVFSNFWLDTIQNLTLIYTPLHLIF